MRRGGDSVVLLFECGLLFGDVLAVVSDGVEDMQHFTNLLTSRRGGGCGNSGSPAPAMAY